MNWLFGHLGAAQQYNSENNTGIDKFLWLKESGW